jgi:hypothetical protein
MKAFYPPPSSLRECYAYMPRRPPVFLYMKIDEKEERGHSSYTMKEGKNAGLMQGMAKDNDQ